MKTRSYLELIRLHNVVGSSLACASGYLITGATNSFYLLISSLVVALIAASGYVINDVFDVKADTISKPWRPLVSGKISIKEAKVIYYLLTLMGNLMSIILGLLPLLYSIATTFLLFSYSKLIKKMAIMGNLLVAFTSASSFLFGSIVAIEKGLGVYNEIILVAFLYIFLFTLIREIAKTIEDVEGDKVLGAKTIAILLGENRSGEVVGFLLLTLIIISPIPLFLKTSIAYLILLIPMNIFNLISCYYMLRNPKIHSTKVRSLLKISAFIGIFAFFFMAIGF
jgi:geranylgeranylglycerol-phosphate geranylgeranyltransferase